MEFDDNTEEDISNEDLEDQTNSQENNVDEAVSMDEDINNKLVEALKSLRLSHLPEREGRKPTIIAPRK